jgi:hypothetical protein
VELMCVCINNWHGIQISNQFRAPSALSPGKGPLLPTGQEVIDFVEMALFGAFVHPYLTKRSHFWSVVRVKCKLL